MSRLLARALQASTPPSRPQRAALTRLAALIEERADAAGRTVADARSAMPMDDEHAHLWDDSIHPSPAGQKTLAAVVLAAMRKHEGLGEIIRLGETFGITLAFDMTDLESKVRIDDRTHKFVNVEDTSEFAPERT